MIIGNFRISSNPHADKRSGTERLDILKCRNVVFACVLGRKVKARVARNCSSLVLQSNGRLKRGQYINDVQPNFYLVFTVLVYFLL